LISSDTLFRERIKRRFEDEWAHIIDLMQKKSKASLSSLKNTIAKLIKDNIIVLALFGLTQIFSILIRKIAEGSLLATS
jgi:hypothetical protein